MSLLIDRHPGRDIGVFDAVWEAFWGMVAAGIVGWEKNEDMADPMFWRDSPFMLRWRGILSTWDCRLKKMNIGFVR